MRLNVTHVPTSVKKIRLTLQPLDEVEESKDFKALHTRLVAETEALHQKLVDDYALIVNTWNCNLILQRFQAQIYILLHLATEGITWLKKLHCKQGHHGFYRHKKQPCTAHSITAGS